MKTQMEKDIDKMFNLSSFRTMKVYHRFKKIVLANSTNEKDIDSIKLYLFQVAESSLYDYDPIDFISEIDCFEFAEKFLNDLSDINTLLEVKVSLNSAFYDLCKSCYKEFCTDILKQTELN